MATIPLTAEDRAILALESGTIAGHTVKVVTLGAPITVEALRGRLAERAPAAPQLTRRLDEPAGAWVDEAGTDLGAHLAETADAGEPLEAAAARALETRLARDRPLWRMELARGGTALVVSLHHAWCDGHGAMALLAAALWDQPDDGGRRPSASPDGERAAKPLPPPPPPHPPAAQQLHLRRAVPGVVVRELLHRRSRSPFAGHVGRRRSVAFAELPLETLHSHKPATVNDALLAVVAGGIRGWAGALDRLPELTAKVPVSLHVEGEAAANRDSWIMVPLDCREPDFERRIAAIHAATATRKAHHDAEVLDHLGTWAQRRAAFAVNVSNVPGPRQAPELLGVPVTGLRSIAEIGEDHALRVAAISLAGTVTVGFSADPELVPRVGELAAASAYAAT